MTPITSPHRIVEPAARKALSVDTRRLIRVGARPPFLDYLVQLWDYRQFIMYDAKARVQSGHRRDRLGSAWLILNPVLNGLVYYAIFGLLLNTSRGIENFLGYLFIGVFLFQFSSRAVTKGARSIQANRAIIQAFNFPRATLPIAVNIREAMANVPVIITMLLMIMVLPPTENVTLLWFLIVPALVLQGIMNLGFGLILARLVSKVNDLSHLLTFSLRAWMYGSAVFYTFDRFVTNPDVLAILEFNPLFQVLDIVRNCVLYAQVPTWQSWAILSLWALASLAVGLVFFWKAEESYGRE